MEQTENTYRRDLDLLKGVAIVAVVLYHMGVARSGYLGVDVFFAVSGFLIVPKVIGEVACGRFRYFRFLERRTLRLLPLMLLVSACCLLAGYMGMLPDDYENLSESVVAANLFSHNIFAAVTTKNYWNPANEYRPLMHAWYVGLLFQFYVVFPLWVMAVKKLAERFRFDFMKYAGLTILALAALSFLLYLNPNVGEGDRFYLLPCRFYELAAGGLTGLMVYRRGGRLARNGAWSGAVFLLLTLILFFGAATADERVADYNLVSGQQMSGDGVVPKNVLQTATVMLTLFLLVSDNLRSRMVSTLGKTGLPGLLGAMSYSIFVWHQPFLAFGRYFVTDEMTLPAVWVYLALVMVVAGLTYKLVEARVRPGRRTGLVVGLALVLINGTAFAIYLRGGVVRDVPELDVRTADAHRHTAAGYNDRLYAFDKDFPADNGKCNVLVIGNSFSRDWGNILLESDRADDINLSYAEQPDESLAERIGRSDYIFVFGWKHDVPYYVWENLKPGAEVWGLGPKSYGTCNGLVYKNRHKPDYYDQSVRINPNFLVLNDRLKAEWKDKYVDLLGLSVKKDGTVPVFSANHKLLSQDCRHLTRGGARHYAALIDFDRIFR